jgi:hypothetical protein
VKIKCLSCGRQISLDEKIYDFWGSIKCFYCSTVMEIQAARGVLIWLNPFPVVNPDYAERAGEHDLQGEQDMLGALQRKTGSQSRI